jgi:hypothetical protein
VGQPATRIYVFRDEVVPGRPRRDECKIRISTTIIDGFAELLVLFDDLFDFNELLADHPRLGLRQVIPPDHLLVIQ